MAAPRLRKRLARLHARHPTSRPRNRSRSHCGARAEMRGAVRRTHARRYCPRRLPTRPLERDAAPRANTGTCPMSNDFAADTQRSEPTTPTRADQTIGSSTIYRLCEEVIALREMNNRQHKVFEQALSKSRDEM